MHKPKNWEDPQDNIAYIEIVSFAISLSTASCGVGVEPLYAEMGSYMLFTFLCLLHSETNFVETWSVMS